MTETQATDAPRASQADDLYRYQVPADPQISPDGGRIVFTLQRVDRDNEKKYTNLWVADVESGRLRQFTHGKWNDSQPRWSPDGRTISFLSNRGNDEQAQLYLLPLDGGEARPLTDLKGSMANYEWSPDGRKLVCQFRKKDADALEREKDETKKKLGVSYRHITRTDYKFDGAGYQPQERWHVWVIDAESGAATQLTDGDKDETEPRWSPDGEQILFASNRADHPDMDLDATELYLIPAEGGEMRRLETRPGRKYGAVFSPDGAYVAYLGRDKPGRWYQNARLYVAAVDGGGARDVSDGIDLHLGSSTNGDVFNGSGPYQLVWSADGRRIYSSASWHGNEPLVSLAAFEPNDEPLWVIDGEGVVGGYTLNAARDRVAWLWSTLDDPAQLRVGDIDDNGKVTASRTLTAINDWQAGMEWGDIEEVWFKARDGYDLHGWILKPPSFDPTKKYPSILEIHGGPQTQYGNMFMHEFHYLAAAGYVVYWSNPRGSQGYGEGMTGSIYGRWGSVDYDDVMDWADYAANLPYIDTGRMGVTGGSYGGYMTTLIIGRTDRFKAAVAQRVVSNFISFYGSSDLNIGLDHLAGTTAPWEDMATCWAQSPISAIGNARTPTLVIHSENDYRCDQEQGEQVYIALKKLGVDTELLLLPGESHGVSRGGRTDRRIARLEYLLGWFERYLK